MGLISVLASLIVIGVLVWAARKLIALVPMEPWIAQVVDVVIIVVVVLAIVFYIVLPLLGMLGGALGGVHIPKF